MAQILPGSKIVPVSSEKFVELLYECVFEPISCCAPLRVIGTAVDSPDQALEVAV
jgi:hypothetical protein